MEYGSICAASCVTGLYAAYGSGCTASCWYNPNPASAPGVVIGSLNWLVVSPILKLVNFSGEGLEFLVKSKNAARPIITIARTPITRVLTSPTELVIDSRKLSAGLAFTLISISAALVAVTFLLWKR